MIQDIKKNKKKQKNTIECPYLQIFQIILAVSIFTFLELFKTNEIGGKKENTFQFRHDRQHYGMTHFFSIFKSYLFYLLKQKERFKS